MKRGILFYTLIVDRRTGAYRVLWDDVIDPSAAWIRPAIANDIASVRVDLRDTVHAIGTSGVLGDDEVGRAMDSVLWRLRDRLAPP